MANDPASLGNVASGRREFLRASLAVAGALPLSQAHGLADAGAPRKPVMDEHDPKNIKLAHRVPSTASDEELLFLQQIGLRWARVELQAAESDFDALTKVQKRFERYGMRIFSAMHPAYRSLKIQLGQDGRDKDIEQYQTFLRNLGRLNIPVANYDFHPGNTYTTAMVQRRAYTAREFNLKDFRQRVEKPRFDRKYEAKEIWDHYAYFLRAVLPVAEKAAVKLALHPDDPPVPIMNGVAKIFTHYEGYRRAEELAGKSNHWGLTFCVGTWSEGGKEMGKDVFEMIGDFGRRGKIVDVHFRNVSAPLPHFVETFPDDGYLDMYRVMRALRSVGFNGAMEPDHVPQLIGDKGIRRAGTAYCIACMRAYLRRANEEVE
ncbi:MAG TPA: mannonate dehydratase [Gemmataceae bacterium]|jgi:mannonate dehydratase